MLISFQYLESVHNSLLLNVKQGLTVFHNGISTFQIFFENVTLKMAKQLQDL